MGEITGLRLVTGREKTIRVSLDGKFAFAMEARAANQAGLRIGQELSESHVQELVKAEQLRRCRDTAVRLLGYRPRSEAELKTKLKQRGFPPEDIEAVMARLKAQGLVDDQAFASFWKEDRETFSPRSRRLTGLELRKKGVSSEIIDRVVGSVDDSESAYRAALGKARRLPTADPALFRRRLGEYLRRRGFGYEVAERTVEALWKEITAAPETARP